LAQSLSAVSPAPGDPPQRYRSVLCKQRLATNIDLTIVSYGGEFILGGAVPEPSTWAMMLVGFAGLGFAPLEPSRAASFEFLARNLM
jgi:hypothetical protein